MIPTEAQLAKMVRVEFPSPNGIPYMMDHGYYRGVPSGVWWIEDVIGEWVSLVRPGYGTKENYGSGSIDIGIKSLSQVATERSKRERKEKEDRVLAEARDIAKRRFIPDPAESTTLSSHERQP